MSYQQIMLNSFYSILDQKNVFRDDGSNSYVIAYLEQYIATSKNVFKVCFGISRSYFIKVFFRLSNDWKRD